MASKGIPMPGPDELPPGPHRDVVRAIHDLYEQAGLPGVRKVANEVTKGDYRDTISHEKFATILHGKGEPPRWEKVEPVVRVLVRCPRTFAGSATCVGLVSACRANPANVGGHRTSRLECRPPESRPQGQRDPPIVARRPRSWSACLAPGGWWRSRCDRRAKPRWPHIEGVGDRTSVLIMARQTGRKPHTTPGAESHLP